MSQIKRALCVGINNYPGTGNDLRGCVNDANAWSDLLKGNFGFAAGDVKMLLDTEATKQNILNGLTTLLANTKAGDVVVFTNSSHGTYIADNADDEEYDEAVCAYDENILDDEFRAIFKTLPKGVRLTVIFDNCHSGTGTRILDLNSEDKKRFMNPEVRGLPKLLDFDNAQPKSGNFSESKMKEVLLSGCRAEEVSWDVKIGDSFHGAMTFCAIQAIKAANYRITYHNLQLKLQKILDDRGYEQHPQLEGKAGGKNRLIFS